MLKIASHKLYRGILRIVLLTSLCLSLSACLGTIVAGVVDTTIEVVKIPFKVGAAVVDVVTEDDFTETQFSDRSEREATPK